MLKRPFLLLLAILSLLSVTMAVSRPVSSAFVAEGATDFYQRHPDWNRNLTGSDYYERHPEWTVSVSNATVDVIATYGSSDYFQRHPALSLPVMNIADQSDYFVRHPELRAPMTTVDVSDYFLRH